MGERVSHSSWDSSHSSLVDDLGLLLFFYTNCLKLHFGVSFMQLGQKILSSHFPECVPWCQNPPGWCGGKRSPASHLQKVTWPPGTSCLTSRLFPPLEWWSKCPADRVPLPSSYQLRVAAPTECQYFTFPGLSRHLSPILCAWKLPWLGEPMSFWLRTCFILVWHITSHFKRGGICLCLTMLCKCPHTKNSVHTSEGQATTFHLLNL